jgi:hypothetical protein
LLSDYQEVVERIEKLEPKDSKREVGDDICLNCHKYDCVCEPKREPSQREQWKPCRLCGGSGIADFEKEKNFAVYGRSLKDILEIIDYAYQHGYSDK